LLGVRTPIVRKIAAQYYAKIKAKPKKEIFRLCERLLKSNLAEERAIAFDWVYRQRRQYTKEDFKIFESWLKKYVANWAACDDLCGHTFGYFVFMFPQFFPRIKTWTHSRNRWLRRASAVILIYSVRKKRMIREAFVITNILLMDNDDMVQKGYGWLLKEVSNQYPDRVYNYVMKHKDGMPRTALRYAIEKLSPSLKKKAMKRS
jgi:3-methyladenine DNA glycosylase AlkD